MKLKTPNAAVGCRDTQVRWLLIILCAIGCRSGVHGGAGRQHDRHHRDDHHRLRHPVRHGNTAISFQVSRVTACWTISIPSNDQQGDHNERKRMAPGPRPCARLLEQPGTILAMAPTVMAFPPTACDRHQLRSDPERAGKHCLGEWRDHQHQQRHHPVGCRYRDYRRHQRIHAGGIAGNGWVTASFTNRLVESPRDPTRLIGGAAGRQLRPHQGAQRRHDRRTPQAAPNNATLSA